MTGEMKRMLTGKKLSGSVADCLCGSSLAAGASYPSLKKRSGLAAPSSGLLDGSLWKGQVVSFAITGGGCACHGAIPFLQEYRSGFLKAAAAQNQPESLCGGKGFFRCDVRFSGLVTGSHNSAFGQFCYILSYGSKRKYSKRSAD